MKLFNKFFRSLYLKTINICVKLKTATAELKSLKNIFIVLAILFSVLSFYLGYNLISLKNNFPSKETLVHFINIGQGDAILIENNKFSILIDSGSNKYSDHLISYLKSLNITKLNYVIASHPHEDHIGSMDDIVKNFHVETFISPKVITSDIDFINLVNALNSKNIKINTVNDNSIISLSPGNYLTFLWSGITPDDNINNNSLVLKYTNKNISFLFTGDMEKEVEDKLHFSNSSDLSSSVLKVPHHGSNSSSTLNFLNSVSPYISVISCGMGNDYGHPHKNTLSNLNNVNSTVYRTDIHGNIIIKTDGNKLWINTECKN